MAPSSLVDGELPSGFDRLVVTVPPGTSRPYDEREWLDAIVVVDRGEIVLQGTCGTGHAFGHGAILWLQGLPLVALHNPGPGPAVLAAVRRARPCPRTERPTMPATAAGPATDLDPRFSSPGARAVPWSVARRDVEEAQVWWLSTVRSDGRPHVTPLLAVWHDDALHFCTGAGEQKAVNLAANDAVALTTGANRFGEGLDVVLEGRAERVADEPVLRRLADAWESKYGPAWRFEVADAAFVGGGGPALVFRVAPTVGFAFSKDEPYGQTRYRFGWGSRQNRG